MIAETTPQKLRFRPVLDEDRAFVFQVYASTREEELASVPWTHEQKLTFLAQQFDAQDLDYRANYLGAEFLVVEVDGRKVGRLYLQRSSTELLVIDMALLGPERGRGIGGRILAELFAEADAANRAVSGHVRQLNPALGLYLRLGFRVVDETGLYWRVIREPRTPLNREPS